MPSPRDRRKVGSGVIQYPVPNGSGATPSTPRPLVTPRLVTPQGASGGVAPAHTLQRPQVFQTGRMSTLGIAPPEKTGDGVLFPALVVAVGQTGLAVLKKLRQLVRDQYGSLDVVPTLRFLYLDTDPEAAEAATRGPDALPAREVVLARLHARPTTCKTARSPASRTGCRRACCTGCRGTPARPAGCGRSAGSPCATTTA